MPEPHGPRTTLSCREDSAIPHAAIAGQPTANTALQRPVIFRCKQGYPPCLEPDSLGKNKRANECGWMMTADGFCSGIVQAIGTALACAATPICWDQIACFANVKVAVHAAHYRKQEMHCVCLAVHVLTGRESEVGSIWSRRLLSMEVGRCRKLPLLIISMSQAHGSDGSIFSTPHSFCFLATGPRALR